jgi:zinc protease
MLALLGGSVARAIDVPTRMELRDVSYDVRSVDLPSGMRVVVEKDATRPLVAVVSVIDVGGSDDPPGKEGLAHLIEHLTFRSLQDQKHSYSDLLELSGAARWNASTSWNLTTYHQVGSKDALTALLSLEAVRMARPLAGITPEVFEAERQVVKNELFERDEQGLVTAIAGRMAGAIFPPGHPNSRAVGGTEASIASLTLDDARAFVKQFYRPERMTLLIAGDVDPAGLTKLLSEHVPGELVDAPASGPVAVKPRLPEKPRAVEEPRSSRDLIRVKAPAEIPIVFVGWPLPSGFDKEGYLDQFVTRMAVRATAWATIHDPDLVGVGATLIRGRTGSMLLCYGRLRDGSNPARSAEAMVDQLVQLWTVSGGASSSDAVRRAEAQFLVRRNQTLVDLATDLEDLGDRAVLRAQLVHMTGETTAVGRELRSIGELTTGSVQSFAYQYLARGRARVVFLEPDGSPAPADRSGGAAFSSGSTLQLKVTPEVLRSRVAAPGAELRSFKLDTGLEVVLARRSSAPVITAILAVRGGSSDGQPPGGPLMAEWAFPVDHTHGAPELYGMFAGRNAWKDLTTIELVAGNGNLPNALGILLDQARSLHVDAAVENHVDREYRSIYRKDYERPHASFDRAVWAAVYGTHPYGRSISPDVFDKAGAGTAQRFIDRAFVPSNAVLVVAGDIRLEEAQAVVASYFAGWKAKADGPAFASGELPGRAEGQVPLVKIPRAGARQTELKLACAIPLKSPADRAAADVLASRIDARVSGFARQVLGSSYGFRSRVTTRPGVVELEVSGAVDSRGAPKVLALLRSEADGLATRTLDAQQLGRAQWDTGLSATTRYESSESLARALARIRLAGLPADTLERYPKDLAELTPAAVQAASAQCRRTATIGLLGEQATLDRLVPSG